MPAVMAALLTLLVALAGLLLAAPAARAQRSVAAPIYQPNFDALIEGGEEWLAALERQGWLLRGQMTTVVQGALRFHAPYAGPNSLSARQGFRNTESVDLVLGRRLWHDAELIAVPSLTRGFGLSNSVGVAAFPNGEAFRLGSRDPYLFMSRLFIRQTIEISADTEGQDNDPMRFAGPLARERITLTLGKVSSWDFFDDNRYAHDARSQFLNWALVGAGAFDFAADARGFTNGAVAEWENGTWAVRQGLFMVARRANALSLDPHFFRGWQWLNEVDRFWQLGGQAGAVRFITGLSRTFSARWDDLTAALATPDANLGLLRHYRVKANLAMNAEQALSPTLGVFARLGWNDGRAQNWMFTEQDWSASAGVALTGPGWGRPEDTLGFGFNVGGISNQHRRFLAAGGIGFITGDGRLRYAPEAILETYYDAKVIHGLNLAANLQLVANPAYNAERGPAVVLGLRARAAF